MLPRPSKFATPNEPVIPVPRETTDPRKVPSGAPVALPQAGEPYPQEGLPYPDPDNPPDFPDAPLVVSALVPEFAFIGSPDFTIRVQGEGFDADTVILWNGSPEPTTLVSPNEVTTGVNMATVSVPSTVAVQVERRSEVSQSLLFEFLASP
jgi:hypothetical protein